MKPAPVELLNTYPVISDQVTREELVILLGELQTVLERRIGHSVVEFGCYLGTASLFIQRLLMNAPSPYEFHVYDSFSGLPEKSTKDLSPAGTQFVSGSLHASKQAFSQNFRRANLPSPIIHKGWFSDLRAADIPNDIGLAFLDGDYYDSIRSSLLLIEANLSPGAVIIIDDYMSESLPGAKKATDEWLSHKPRRTQQVRAGMAIIRDGIYHHSK